MPKHEFQMRSLILYWIILSHHFIVRYKSNAYRCCCLVWIFSLCVCVYVTHKGKISFAGVTMNCVSSCIKCALFVDSRLIKNKNFQHWNPAKFRWILMNFASSTRLNSGKTILCVFFFLISILSSANIHNECRIVVGWIECFAEEWEWYQPIVGILSI